MDDEANNLDRKVDLEALKRALKGHQPPLLFIPKSVDDVIIGAAQKQAAGVRRRLWQRPLLAAAASILLAGGIFFSFKPATSHFAYGDVNRDGLVDIIDALALAKATASEDRSRDINKDGQVNLQDAEALASQIVLLPTAK